MADNTPRRLRHIQLSGSATPRTYTRPHSGGGAEFELPLRDRQKHANSLLSQLDTIKDSSTELFQRQKAREVNDVCGLYLTFKSALDFELKFVSLEFQTSGIELCLLKKHDGIAIATVFVPEGKLKHFIKKIRLYRDENTIKGNPKNRDMVESISDISLAAIDALWSDEPSLLPDKGQDIWWEIWLRQTQNFDVTECKRALTQFCEIEVAEEQIRFFDRTIILARATSDQIALSLEVLGSIAELRKAKVAADFYTDMDRVEQRDWIEETLQRLETPSENVPYITLMDTGLNEQHPLLIPFAHSVDMHSYNPAWGTDDKYGHGTAMAGIAIFGDLTLPLSSSEPITITHRLESVKITPDPAKHKDPRLFGAITRESVSRVEVIPDRVRSFLLAVTSSDSRDRGRPSSWSAAIDAISSGYDDDETKRLFIISSGNTDPSERHLSPASNMTDQVHDPGQAWNALTVGAYTEKVGIDTAAYPGWNAIADFGDLSPASCTSMEWAETEWPFKPDIVMEGGNMGVNPTNGQADYIDDGLQLLSTGHQFAIGKQLVSFGDTSASAALAANLLAQLNSQYPLFWPETLRALIIHSAEWSDAMKSHFHPLNLQRHYRQLLRYCGYGIPNVEELMWSAENSLTLIAQDYIRPFFKDKSKIKTKNINCHTIPWPTDVLQSLGETTVEMKVTLSYFIEPNPGERGYINKFKYASHGLRFDVKRPLESLEAFHQRINDQAREDDYERKATPESGKWLLGEKLRNSGSIHCDTWEGTASELSERGHLAVYPVGGWWKERIKLERWKNTVRYALVISIKTPGVETDIYTPIVSQIKVAVAT